ncbi:hypothetical protein HBNXHr_2797 [Halorhabdus sp. BNX81]|nr:hypothetical protein HBNXHr_2797 [Halorhabdus sp. BNX81]
MLLEREFCVEANLLLILTKQSRMNWWGLSLSAALSRRLDSVATHEAAYSVGDYRWNRSSGGRFAGTARRTARAVHAARRTILMNSL